MSLLPLADPEAGRLLADVPEDRRLGSWWLVSSDGRPVPGDRGGGIALLTALGPTHRLGRVLGALGLSATVDALDRWLSVTRGRLGRFVPDGPAPRCFP